MGGRQGGGWRQQGGRLECNAVERGACRDIGCTDQDEFSDIFPNLFSNIFANLHPATRPCKHSSSYNSYGNEHRHQAWKGLIRVGEGGSAGVWRLLRWVGVWGTLAVCVWIWVWAMVIFKRRYGQQARVCVCIYICTHSVKIQACFFTNRERVAVRVHLFGVIHIVVLYACLENVGCDVGLPYIFFTLRMQIMIGNQSISCRWLPFQLSSRSV